MKREDSSLREASVRWEAGEVLELIFFVIAVAVFFFFVPLKAQAQLNEGLRVCHLNQTHKTGERFCTGKDTSLTGVQTPYLDLKDWLQQHSADGSQGPGEKE